MGEIYHTPWEYDTRPFRIADNLYFVGNRDVSVHLIDTGDGLILIDTAYPQTAYLLLESIRVLGFDPGDIKYILHTHAHYDHIGATRMLTEKYGCKTVMGAADAAFLTTRTELTWHREFGMEYHEFFVLDMPVKGGDIVRHGNTCIECIETPGHTPGNMTYRWLTTWNRKPYYAAISGGFGLNTVTAEYMWKYHLTGWRDNHVSSMEKLKDLKVDITLGAHPVFNDTFQESTMISAETNPFIDPKEWTLMLQKAEANFAELIRNDP